MKFEMDKRTGQMVPKKDEQIYFGRSMGGGLRIDDKKHNIKYIIERDEKITNIFGVRGADDLNIYDLRDARIIADRVLRMFGSKHKYTNYKYFLKGCRMPESVIMTYDEFLNEGMFDQGIKRAHTDEVREEDNLHLDELNQDDFYYYFVENYDIVKEAQFSMKETTYDISIPLVYNRHGVYVIECSYDNDKLCLVHSSKSLLNLINSTYPNLLNALKKFCAISTVNYPTFSPKDNTELTQTFVKKIVDTFIKYIDKPGDLAINKK